MLVLPTELTHAQARACLDVLLAAARMHREPLVVVDATALTRFDSSALAVLLAVRRECLLDGRQLATAGMAPRLRQLAGLYGVSALLPELQQAADELAAPTA